MEPGSWRGPQHKPRPRGRAPYVANGKEGACGPGGFPRVTPTGWWPTTWSGPEALLLRALPSSPASNPGAPPLCAPFVAQAALARRCCPSLNPHHTPGLVLSSRPSPLPLPPLPPYAGEETEAPGHTGSGLHIPLILRCSVQTPPPHKALCDGKPSLGPGLPPPAGSWLHLLEAPCQEHECSPACEPRECSLAPQSTLYLPRPTRRPSEGGGAGWGEPPAHRVPRGLASLGTRL